MSKGYVIINSEDNVATALRNLEAGKEIILEGEQVKIVLREAVEAGHKFSLADLSPGDEVVKYGAVIGIASCPISVGCHVHLQNVESNRGRGDKS